MKMLLPSFSSPYFTQREKEELDHFRFRDKGTEPAFYTHKQQCCVHRNHTRLENLDSLDLSNNRITELLILRTEVTTSLTHSVGSPLYVVVFFMVEREHVEIALSVFLFINILLYAEKTVLPCNELTQERVMSEELFLNNYSGGFNCEGRKCLPFLTELWHLNYFCTSLIKGALIFYLALS